MDAENENTSKCCKELAQDAKISLRHSVPVITPKALFHHIYSGWWLWALLSLEKFHQKHCIAIKTSQAEMLLTFYHFIL